MPYYYNIPNEHLRMLVMASESIHSLAEDDLQKTIEQIAGLDEEAQVAMIATLEDEQRAIAAAKRARGITPKMEMAHLNRDIVALETIRHEFENAVLQEKERAANEQHGSAEDILKNIQ